MPDYTISQFDTTQYHQAYATLAAICGPNVAEAFAKYYGDTFSPDQIVNLAKEQGLWSAQTGMYGPQAEKALLDRLGIPVDYSPTLNLQDLTNKILSGMTGAISTPGHYYFLQGYDPNTGLFDTGQTGSVYKGGGRYLSIDQMQKLSGPVSGVFTSKAAGQSTGTANQTTALDYNDKESVKNYIRAAATARGIDPEIAVAVANSEGLNTYVGDNGSSYGPFQLHYGNVAGGGNAVSGLGDSFTRQTGLDARNPDTLAAQIDFALDNAAQNGWGAWHGAQKIGIGNYTGIGSNAKALGISSSQGGYGPPLPNGAGNTQAANVDPLRGLYNSISQLMPGVLPDFAGLKTPLPAKIFGSSPFYMQPGSMFQPLPFTGPPTSMQQAQNDWINSERQYWNNPTTQMTPLSLWNAPNAQPDIMSRMARPWSVYG